MAQYNPAPAAYFLGNVDSFEFIADANLSATAVVTAGRMVGFTRQSYKAGDVGVAYLSGRLSHYNLPLATTATAAITQGTEVYLDSTGKVTTTATNNTLVGCLYQTVESGDAFADVLIYNPMAS